MDYFVFAFGVVVGVSIGCLVCIVAAYKAMGDV